MDRSIQRYFVPDLSPKDRPGLRGIHYRYVFVAESPHVSEVQAERVSERRPLCGAAGKVWWGALCEVLGEAPLTELSAEHLILFCRKHQIAVLNAVQFPLDPKIVERVKDQNAHPVRTVGFSKAPGSEHYRRCNPSHREEALRQLRERLFDSELRSAKIVALGNDAEWFLRHSLNGQELSERLECKIAHPSAWWRRGGFFGQQARQILKRLF